MLEVGLAVIWMSALNVLLDSAEVENGRLWMWVVSIFIGLGFGFGFAVLVFTVPKKIQNMPV